MTAIALAPEPSTTGPARRLNPPPPPSFEIRGAVGLPLSGPRWDRINSAVVIARARRIYYAFLSQGHGGLDPCGVVIDGLEDLQDRDTPQGRVVFAVPVLLPDEQFIPLELIRGRSGRGRSSRPFARG